MPALSKDIIGNRLTVLSKGQSSTGKTIAACSFATEKRKAFVFDLDHRMQSVNSFYKKHAPKYLDWIFYEKFQDWDSINKRIDAFIKTGECPFGVINLASLTSLCRMITTESINLRRDNKTASNRPAEDNAIGNELMVGNIPVNSIQDYKAENNGVAIILTKLIYHSAFKDTHIFVDAHLMEWTVENLKAKKEEDRKRVIRKIITAGKAIAEEVPIYFNEKWVFTRGIGQLGDTSYVVKFRDIPEDDFDDAPTTTFMELPKSIDWTNKIFSQEFAKYVPIFKEGE